MSPATIFLGDELSATGFRLAGLDARTPAQGEEAAGLEQALKEGRSVLLGARFASLVPAATLEAALTLLQPMVMVLPDWDGSVFAGDPAAKVRRVLGFET